MTGLKILAIMLVLPGLVAWELPFTSQRIRGDNDYRDENYPNAIEHYNRALEGNTGDWEIYYNLGTSYYHSGQWEDAVEQLNIAAGMAEDQNATEIQRAYIHHNLGLSYLQLDDCERATENLAIAEELAPWEDDIGKNLNFAEEYCSGAGEDAENNEGEEEDQGEGDQQDDQQGQADEGDSNDENEAEDDSQCEEGQQEGGSGEQENDSEPDSESQGEEQSESSETGDENESENELGGQGDQEETEEQPGEGEETDEEQSESGDNKEEDQGNEGQDTSDEKEGADGEEQGGGERDGNAEESGPREVPDDGLNLSDTQVSEILEYMSDLEHSRAPRYFHNDPAEGDMLDPDTAWDLFRRFFMGESSDKSDTMPDDGIDW